MIKKFMYLKLRRRNKFNSCVKCGRVNKRRYIFDKMDELLELVKTMPVKLDLDSRIVYPCQEMTPYEMDRIEQIQLDYFWTQIFNNGLNLDPPIKPIVEDLLPEPSDVNLKFKEVMAKMTPVDLPPIKPVVVDTRPQPFELNLELKELMDKVIVKTTPVDPNDPNRGQYFRAWLEVNPVDPENPKVYDFWNRMLLKWHWRVRIPWKEIYPLVSNEFGLPLEDFKLWVRNPIHEKIIWEFVYDLRMLPTVNLFLDNLHYRIQDLGYSPQAASILALEYVKEIKERAKENG